MSDHLLFLVAQLAMPPEGWHVIPGGRKDDDVDLIKAATVTALAGLRQARAVALPPLTKPGVRQNPPFPDWPPSYRSQFDLEQFTLLEDLLHFDVCIAPFWPAGNANCPLFRITTLYDAVRRVDPVRAVILPPGHHPAATIMPAEEQERLVERAYERMGLLPKETFLLWLREADRMADDMERVQQARNAQRQQVVLRLRDDPVTHRLNKSLRSLVEGLPMAVQAAMPAEVQHVIQRYVADYGGQQVADMLLAMPPPVSATLWDAMVALATSGEP